MKEFPHHLYRILNKCRESSITSTFLVKPHYGAEQPRILKLYTTVQARENLSATERDLAWQKGLVHPLLAGINDSATSGKRSFFTTRPSYDSHFDLSQASVEHFKQILDAVRFLHAHGRPHGGLKPSNIFSLDGRVQLADLGLLKFDDSSDPDNIRFTAPEVLAGEPPTIESDYYSIGAILYRFYTKRDPFDDPILENLKAKYLHLRISSLRNIDGIREPVAGAIDGLFSKNLRHRTNAFLELLREFPFKAVPVSRPPMVGRQDTMERLQTWLTSTEQKKLAVCLVEGADGIGKSRLIEELQFKSRFNNVPFFVGTCLEQNEPNVSPIIRLIQEVVFDRKKSSHLETRDILGSFADTLLPFFEENPVGRIENANERVLHDLIGLLASFSRQLPFSLCIEDVESAEPSTLHFFRQLLARASELNLRLLLTCRASMDFPLSDEMSVQLGGAFSRIHLDPLTRSESRDLIGFLASDPSRTAQILKSSGGNPLYLLENSGIESGATLARRLHLLIHRNRNRDSLKIIQALVLHRIPASAEFLAIVVAMNIEFVQSELIWLRSIGAIRESKFGVEMQLESLRTQIQSEMSARSRRALHRNLYKVLESGGSVAESLLADHAFHGGLWNSAAKHQTSLSKTAMKQGDNFAALDHYEKLKTCLKKLNQELPVERNIEIATCLARTGRQKLAEQIYARIWEESGVTEDLRIGRSLLNRGGDIDRTTLDQRLRILREAIESSRGGSLHPSALFSKLGATLILTGDLPGATDALMRAQQLLQRVPDKDAYQVVKGAEAFLQMNNGHFQMAYETYRSLSCETWTAGAAAMTNRALCLEYLGKIRAARDIQRRASLLASKAGHLVGQTLCLTNLGIYSTKLGIFKEAHAHFDQIKKIVLESGPSAGISFKGVESEEALLEFLAGNYNAAFLLLHAAIANPALLIRRHLECRILECEVLFEMGAAVSGSDVDKIAAEGAWSPSPIYAVQLAILRSRTIQSVPDAIEVLNNALAKAREWSLLYEECRLHIEFSDRLFEMDPTEAQRHSEEAIEISKKYGYRPLLSKALLFRGLSARHDKERSHFLQQSFKLASEVGIPEIISQSSYYLGALHHSTKQNGVAREYLATSTRVTSEIASRIPDRYRAKYLSKPWRAAARKLFQEYIQDQPIRLPAVENAPSPKEHPHFRALYRISVAAASAKTVEDFIRDLLPAISQTPDKTVVMLKAGDHTDWFSFGISVSDELRQRVLSVSNKARDQFRFNARDRWIPIRSIQFSGGMFVISRKGSQIGEDEMEYFTILGTFVGSALDQIHTRISARPVVAKIKDFHGIVGDSRPMRELRATLETISNNNATVLIQGETGTGKELVARAIHKLSARSKATFIPLDCGAIAESLMESELFGSKRGSFTGAIEDRPGVFEAAHHGTLFLDEISNLNLSMQAKLLRVLQEREIRRIGETRIRPIDVRLIVASNANLMQLVAEGSFRQDLLFRLNVIGVSVPPLRQRREDIADLAAHFLHQLNSEHKTSRSLGPEALLPLFAHSFPGNIRELRNCIERSYFTAAGRTIVSIPLESTARNEDIHEVQAWLADLSEGRRNFWTAIHKRYKSRDISRETVTALIDLGLRATRGSYRSLASLLRIEPGEYRKLMDFLRRNKCLLDFRPYRKAATPT